MVIRRAEMRRESFIFLLVQTTASEPGSVSSALANISQSNSYLKVRWHSPSFTRSSVQLGFIITHTHKDGVYFKCSLSTNRCMFVRWRKTETWRTIKEAVSVGSSRELVSLCGRKRTLNLPDGARSEKLAQWHTHTHTHPHSRIKQSILSILSKNPSWLHLTHKVPFCWCVADPDLWPSGGVGLQMEIQFSPLEINSQSQSITLWLLLMAHAYYEVSESKNICTAIIFMHIWTYTPWP